MKDIKLNIKQVKECVVSNRFDQKNNEPEKPK